MGDVTEVIRARPCLWVLTSLLFVGFLTGCSGPDSEGAERGQVREEEASDHPCFGLEEGATPNPDCADRVVLDAIDARGMDELKAAGSDAAVRYSRSLCALGREMLESSDSSSTYQDLVESLEASWNVGSDVVEQSLEVVVLRCPEEAAAFEALPLRGGAVSATLLLTGAGAVDVEYIVPEVSSEPGGAEGLTFRTDAPSQDVLHLSRAQDISVRIVPQPGVEAGCAIVVGGEQLVEQAPSPMPSECTVSASEVASIEPAEVERD